MGYYTNFVGKIDYSDVSKTNQEVIEKAIDMIELLKWGCSSSYISGISTNFYNEDNRWIHFFHADIDKDNKIIDLDGERKDYHEATATFLSLIAPYLNKEKEFTIEYLGEDYDEEVDDYYQLKVIDGKVFDEGDLFETNNKLSFPFPTTYKQY